MTDFSSKLPVLDGADGPVSPGTAASVSMLTAGVFNSTPPTLTTGQQVAIQLNSSGSLKVDGSAVVQPVSQSGTWKTQVVNSSNVSVDAKTLATQVVSTDVGLVTNSVIHGLTTGGGGGYVDVKVNPSGALQTALGDISGVVGQNVMASSLPVVLASNQTGINTFLDKAGTGTIVALNGAVTATTNGASTVFFNITGTWAATLLFEGQDGNGNWTGILGTVPGNGSATASTGSNIGLTVPCGGYNQVRVRASTFTSGTVNVNYNVGAGLSTLQVFNLTPTAFQATTRANDGAGNAITSTTLNGKQRWDSDTILTGPGAQSSGFYATVSGYSRLLVSPEASSLFMDKFDTTLDTTNRWTTTTSGGATVSNTGGVLSIVTGTTASAVGVLASQPSFMQYANVQLQFGMEIQLESSPIATNTYRFWGFGSAASNTTAAPLTDAVGFEIDTSGNLNAVVWQAGTKIFSTTLTAVTDGGIHRYSFQWRTDKIVYYVDSNDTVAAIANYQIPAVQTLPVRIQTINGTGTVSKAPVLKSAAIGIGDVGRNSAAISDGTYPWRKSTVLADGSLPVEGNVASLTTDSGNPVKIGTVYNTTLPAPTNGQRVDVQSNQFGEVTFQYRNKFRNITGNATTVVKSGAGRFHGISINNNATGGTVTVYDNTAGSGTIIQGIQVGSPSGGLFSSTGLPGATFLGPLGAEFSTGLTVVTAGSANNNVTIFYQ